MLPAALWLLCLAVVGGRAQTTTNEFYSTTFSTLSTFQSSGPRTDYTYHTKTGQKTVNTASESELGSSSGLSISATTTSKRLTVLGGNSPTANGTASSTSTAARASNTVPCNGFPEFCNRQYSNITNICTHNSAYVVPNNAGSNQLLPIIDQLNDGVRMLQGGTHYVNNTVMNCHTSCDLLNAGPWQGSLEILALWLRRNPYDVVTWLISNSDFVEVEKFVPAIQNSGVAQYLYEPKYIPQRRDQWPTLGEMIISGKRLVIFMDYKANQKKVPYILDQYSHIWQTPFSPTNQSFPCTVETPPHLNETKARDEWMYLANHNLNTAVDISALLGSGSGDSTILIPNTAEIHQTNGQFDRYGQLEATRINCTRDWGRPPNFMVVDYYNLGDPKNGSVFEVAARANGVTYNRKCCGLVPSSAPTVHRSSVILVLALAFAVVLAW